jgi:hypothetical protein
LANLVKKLKKRNSTKDQVRIIDSRRRLQSKIDAFLTNATKYLSADLIYSEDSDSDNDSVDRISTAENDFATAAADLDADDDSAADSAADDDSAADSVSVADGYNRIASDDDSSTDAPNAESFRLILPSTLGMETCSAKGKDYLANIELQLRIGQANDALHEIRLALGHKSLLFRTSIRGANSQRKKTRAFKDLASIETIVRSHASIYRLARLAMLKLGASDALLEKYQSLTKEDLKVTTITHDPSITGQRNTHLAWFWQMDISAAASAGSHMEECTSADVFWRWRWRLTFPSL